MKALELSRVAAPMAKILLVEDDKNLALSVCDFLAADGHTVEHAETGEDGLQLLDCFDFELAILDWHLPGIDGLEVCRSLRKQKMELPVLFLTALSDVDFIETGLNAGADDYLLKPFHFRELTARVRSLLRRPKGLLSTVVHFGYLTIELESKSVTVEDKKITLAPKEFAILEFLIRNPNRHFSSKALLKSIWPSENESSEDSVRTIMHNLKRKITPEGKECVIKTAAKSGYILEGTANIT